MDELTGRYKERIKDMKKLQLLIKSFQCLEKNNCYGRIA